MNSGNKSLSALVEDEDEEEYDHEKNGSDEENDREESKEPNKFDILCDGVINSMAIVQTAVQELLNLKDDLLQHALPPAVLIQLATVCGRVFRSVSDQGKPISELVRMVQVYSTPWEEKSAALKKLHDDYENKQRQLNIAIKRLQLVDTHSRRIAKEKRIMNWEKLFAKVTSVKGHGRRWKFLIETIKQKAKMGYEHVQEYTRSLEESSESESESENEEDDTLVGQQSTHDGVSSVPSPEKQESVGVGDDNEDNMKEDDNDDEEPNETDQTVTPEDDNQLNTTIHYDQYENVESVEHTESGSISPKRVRFGGQRASQIVVKPETNDQSVWTDEVEYDHFLYVRIFKPTGLDHHELKCSLTYGNQMFKTGVLDLLDEEEDKPVSPVRPQAAGRHHGRTSRSPHIEEPAPKKFGKYEEFMINLNGTQMTSDQQQTLQFAVQQGQFEEIVAMASVQIADLQELDLKTIYLPAITGDDNVLKERDLEEEEDSLTGSIDIPLTDNDSDKNASPADEILKHESPIPFPLFSLKSGRGSMGPAGSIPLIFYWGKRPQPKQLNRQTGTMGVYDLVYDLTGIDLHTTTKEDLHKEHKERASSAILFTPEPTEETVLKSEFDALKINHEGEILQLQSKYESRLQELMDNLQYMTEQQHQQQQIQRLKSNSPRPASVASRSSSAKSIRSVKLQPQSSASSQHLTSVSPVKTVTPGGDLIEPLETSVVKSSPVTPAKPRSIRPLPMPPRVYKNFKVGKPLPKWGENLPEDFFERLKLFEEESKLRKEELNERTLAEIKHNIEQKLAGQHKLSKREEEMYDALKDVSLPALFMPYKTGNIYNPRAHQYFHPTGSTDFRLTQPPSVFQLPPLKSGDKMSVLNLFDLSKNFHRPKDSWLMDRYIEQQHPMSQPGFPQSSERSLSGLKSSVPLTQLTSGSHIPSKCGNSVTERQPPDGAVQDQVEAQV